MIHQSIFATDDNQRYTEMIQDILRDVGYTHVTCHTGQDAFEAIYERQPDLMLLDINRSNPGRGWSVLDSLQLHPKTHHIPVIICSTDMRMVNQKQICCMNSAITCSKNHLI